MKYIKRFIHKKVLQYLQIFPAVAILGPRQSGKSTLAQMIISDMEQALYLDLEKSTDFNKLSNPELFFRKNRDKLICLDEIQRLPEIFSVLRPVIDEERRNGRFLILGSASRNLIKQSSETLAGRIGYLELTPFLLPEVVSQNTDPEKILDQLWIRGGFPRSFLSENEEHSLVWKDNFIRTYLERDIPQLGFQIPAETLRRLWQMCAHCHGQILNSSQIGQSLGFSHTTIRSYIDLLSQTFMIRILQPLEINLKKRLIKSPKIYIRDTGILHALLGIEHFNQLLGHPSFGSSWEGLVIENILALLSNWDANFFRTSNGSEIDLFLTKGRRRIAIECKASTAPKLSKSFWNTLDYLQADEAWVISLVDEKYPIRENVWISDLCSFLNYIV